MPHPYRDVIAIMDYYILIGIIENFSTDLITMVKIGIIGVGMEMVLVIWMGLSRGSEAFLIEVLVTFTMAAVMGL